MKKEISELPVAKTEMPAKKQLQMIENQQANSPTPTVKNLQMQAHDTGGTLVMGILNVTPDSFSDGGRYFDPGKAVARGLEISQQGANIIDVGGQSTRPGATVITPEEELHRILPVVRELNKEGITVSVDTFYSSVAEKCIDAGAKIINDVTGGEHDKNMLKIAASRGCIYIGQHWGGDPKNITHTELYEDVVAEVKSYLSLLAKRALEAGVEEDKLVLDPGFGFGKNSLHNWQILAHLAELQEIGHNLIIGTSRKRFLATVAQSWKENCKIAKTREAKTSELKITSGDSLEAEKDLLTAATTNLAGAAKLWGVRVHNVSLSVECIKSLYASGM